MEKEIIDILIYIALSEEFEHIVDSLGIKLQALELQDHPITYYKGTIKSVDSDSIYNVILFPAGRMGNTESGVKTQILVSEFNPKNIVVLGISGSLHGDLTPGDVFIPTNVIEYLANSAAVGDETLTFTTSGNSLPSDPRLLNRFQNFGVSKRDVFKSWQNSTEKNYSEHITKDMQNELKSIDVKLRSKALFKVADDRNLASGPVVGKGNAFLNFVKSIDRKIVAIEMESAGVYTSGFSQIQNPRVISIRGISDLATEKKEEIEKIVGEELRKVCMKNAVSILKLAIKHDFFKAEGVATNTKKINQEIVTASAIKKVFIVGGETENGNNVDDSVDDLREACREVGRQLAKSELELIVCSPFTDSADYYTAKGYAEEKKEGRIYFHLPNNKLVLERLIEFEKMLLNANGQVPTIVMLRYANYTNEALKQQAWNICQIQALQDCDAVVAIGGKDSSSANLLLHLAELWNKPIVPFTFNGGAAESAFNRIDWNKLYPNIPKEKLTKKDNTKNVVDILHRMSLDNIAREVEAFGRINDVFISRATADSATGKRIQSFLKAKNVNVLFGDDAIVPEKEVLPAINESMSQSQLFIALWSKNYALSPWCYDELMYAISREKVGLVKVIIIQLDDTPIIPAEARALIQIKNKSTDYLSKELYDILNLD